MTKRNDPEIRLGKLELQIMNVVWDRHQATVHNVKDALSQSRKHAYSTILTMMRKLEQKGYLEHEVRDRTYVYCATIGRQAVRRGLLGDLLERAFDDSPALLLNNLLDHKHVSEDELRQIRKLIAEGDTKDE